MIKRVLNPVTTPQVRRSLISGRDALVGIGATARTRCRSTRPRPDFLIVGAQKAGTTFLYQELLRHPQVRPALTKEIHFFDDRYQRGLEWYAGFFAYSDGHPPVITGEASPGYLFHPHALRRIARDLPDVKVIVLLRDPVRRAFSQYCHERRLGYEQEPTFAGALDLEAQRLDGELERMVADETYVSFPYRHFSYRTRGDYLEQVRRAHELLGRERVMVVASESLYSDGCRVLAEVAAFLDLSPWVPERLGGNDMAAGTSTPLGDDVEGDLRAHFRPRNEALFEYLGSDLGWA